MFLLDNPLDVLNQVNVMENVIKIERTAIGYILNWIRLIGTGVALIMLTFIAIKFMGFHGGGPKEKGEAKHALRPYLIGAIILIGATNIVYFIEEFISDILGDIEI